jgi:hypothetical protein
LVGGAAKSVSDGRKTEVAGGEEREVAYAFNKSTWLALTWSQSSAIVRRNEALTCSGSSRASAVTTRQCGFGFNP